MTSRGLGGRSESVVNVSVGVDRSSRSSLPLRYRTDSLFPPYQIVSAIIPIPSGVARKITSCSPSLSAFLCPYFSPLWFDECADRAREVS